jgi:hypothetical protein
MKGILPLMLLVSVIFPDAIQAQSFFAVRRERTIILTAGTGSSTYYGELSNPGTTIKFQPNLNVGLQKYVSSRISVRTELNWFELQGSDAQANSAARKARGLSFRSSCFEISATGAINLYANGNRYYRRPGLDVYAFTGIGLLYFNPKADYKGKSYSLEPLHTEGVSYSRVVPVIPVGLGIRIKTGPNTNIVFEGGYRKTFTDYIDDVSSKYIAPGTDPVANYFENPNNTLYNPAATTDLNNYKAGSKRGNPSNTDSYFLLNVKVEYYLPFASGRNGNGLLKRSRSKSMYRYNKRGGLRRR